MENDFQPLDELTLTHQAQEFALRDPQLGRIFGAYGPPPLWPRQPGFPSLIHIILEQQVSLASARAAFDRLLEAVAPLTPGGLLELDDARMKAIGFSRQKTAYARGLACDLIAGRLDLTALERMDDEAARQALMSVRGIGAWTAEIYLLLVLRRPDTWPVGDLALARAVQRAFGLENLPTAPELVALGNRWRPWRAVAARMLWHDYLSQP